MFSGGDHEEVRRWLANFVLSHAKRESPRVEATVEAEGADEAQRYRIRLRLGDRILPAPGADALLVTFAEARDERGSLAWCQTLAGRVRALARELVQTEQATRRSA